MALLYYPFHPRTVAIYFLLNKMVHTMFDPSTITYDEFYSSDSEEESQDGFGFAKYVGMPYQRGYGYGYPVVDIFGGVPQIVMTAIRKIGKELGKEAIPTAAKIIANLAQGQEAKEVLKNETKAATKRIAARIAQGGDGEEDQDGDGVPRKRRKRRHSKKKKSSPVRRSPRRRKKSRKTLIGRKVLRQIALKNPKSDLGFY